MVSVPSGEKKPVQVTKEMVIIPVVITRMPTLTRLPTRVFKSTNCALSHFSGSAKLSKYFEVPNIFKCVSK